MTDKRTDGCYVAYSDTAELEGVAVFSSEIAALRSAVAKGMKVERVPFGVDLHEAVNANLAAAAAPTTRRKTDPPTAVPTTTPAPDQ